MRKKIKPILFSAIFALMIGVISSSVSAAIPIPANVSASDGLWSNFVKIIWDSPTTSGTHAIYRSTTIGGTYEYLGYVPYTQHYYNDSTATQGVTYYYHVKSCIDITCSDPSANDSGWRGYINTVSSINATDGTISDYTFIVWSSTSGASYYKVYRSVSIAGSKVLAGQTNNSFYFDTEVSPVSPYYYWVAACTVSDVCGEFYYYDSGRRAWPVVQNVVASDGGYAGYVHVTWDAVSGADGYKVYYSTNGGSTYLGSQTTGNTASYDYTLSQVGFNYTFAVTPCFTGNCGSTKSAPDSGWLDFASPTGMSASIDTNWINIIITWNEVDPDAWYYIFRDTLNLPTGKTLIGTSGSAEAFDDNYSRGALPGLSYQYWVVACPYTASTATDPGCSQYSTPATGRYLPGTPTNIAASDGTSLNYVQVTWDVVDGASYQIERTSVYSGPWSYIGSSISNSYQDTTAVEGVKYYYRVKACGDEICGQYSGNDSGYLQSTCYALTLTTVGNGGLSGDPSNSLGCNAGSYIATEALTLYASPSPEWVLSGWSGTDNDTSNSTTNVVTMPAGAHEVTVTFIPKTYSLYVYKNGNGNVTSNPTGINCGTDCTENYNSGTLVTLTATPDSGYTFNGWSGDCTGTGVCEVSMTTGRGVTATFVPAAVTPTEQLTNTSFEVNIPAEWRDSENMGPDEGPDCGVGTAYTGSCALVFHGDGTFKRVFSLNPYSASAGDQFTLSMYRKGQSVPSVGHTYANLILFYTDGTKDTFVLWLHQGTDLNAWQERSMTVTAAKNVKRYNLNIFYKKASGTLWVDDISLTRNGGGNLVPDPSFETWKPDDWMLSENFTPDDGMACGAGDAYVDSCGLTFVGDGTSKRLLMRVRHAGNAGEVLTFSVMRKGVALPTGAAYVNVILVNTDGTQSHNILWLHQGDWSTWGERTFDITAAKDYKWINVNIFYKKPTGTIWLDNISLLAP